MKGRAVGKSIDADIRHPGGDSGDTSPPIVPGPGQKGVRGLEPVPGGGSGGGYGDDGRYDYPYEPPGGRYGDDGGYDTDHYWHNRYGNWGWWYGPVGYTWSPNYWNYSWYSPWCFPYSGLTSGFWFGYHSWYGRSYFSFWSLRSSYYYSGWCSPYSAFYYTGYNYYYRPTITYSSLSGCRGGYDEFHALYGSYVDYRCCSSDVTVYVTGDATASSPDSSVVVVDAGATESVEEAAEPAESAADLDTDSLLRLGDYHFREREYDRAVEFYTQALDRLPTDPTVRLALGDALYALGDYHYASYMIRQALDIDTTWVSRSVDKREFYEDPADFERQLRRLERYVESHPFDEAALFLLGYNYHATGQPVLAKDYFLRVRVINAEAAYVTPFLEAVRRDRDD